MVLKIVLLKCYIDFRLSKRCHRRGKRMKILTICGSPRKGGTFKVLNSIKEEFPDINYEILMLKDMNMKDCLGCYVCINRGPEYCPLKDDRDVILRKMEEADGVIFATPRNTRHVHVLMK